MLDIVDGINSKYQMIVCIQIQIGKAIKTTYTFKTFYL